MDRPRVVRMTYLILIDQLVFKGKSQLMTFNWDHAYLTNAMVFKASINDPPTDLTYLANLVD